MYRINRSYWRKGTALLLAVAAFVLLYETQMLDSQRVAELLMGEEPEVKPGAPLQFRATAYCKGTTTASGVRVRTGIAAADPALLPVGSVVSVDVGDAKYNGIYTVMDTGPAVKGRVLDLYIWSCYEALEFGRKRVQVTVLRLGWDPKASSPTLVDRLFRGREAKRATSPESRAPSTDAAAPAAGIVSPGDGGPAAPAPPSGARAEPPAPPAPSAGEAPEPALGTAGL
jgi:3D (Asp-Asp-Asp) domain-containing protein